jgi:hyaluronan synthase
MQHLRREFPDLVRLVRFEGNRGKRSALVSGIRAAQGEIIVTIDSDSEIEPRTIHEMVVPFLADKQVGAVAGRVSVLNRDSPISRMLEVQFALAFDYGRAAPWPVALAPFPRFANRLFYPLWMNGPPSDF